MVDLEIHDYSSKLQIKFEDSPYARYQGAFYEEDPLFEPEKPDLLLAEHLSSMIQDIKEKLGLNKVTLEMLHEFYHNVEASNTCKPIIKDSVHI